jgi:uncharacterized membrane-anchored protein
MTRVLGVFMVLVALAVTATADERTKKNVPAKAGKQAPAPAAEAPPPDADGAGEETGDDAPLTPEEIEASLPPHVKGPKLVDLGHNIEIDVPADFILLERVEARKLLEQGGDFTDDVLAVVARLDANWMIVIEYSDVGYVDDSDADKLDATELFNQYQEGTKQQNVKRKSLGVPELFLDGWSEMPKYKQVEHHLVWGLQAHSSEGPVINFFTRILGRHGYMSVNLIDAPDAIEKSKLDSQPVLASVRFKTGYTYEDYREGDKNSGLGLRALVLGGAGVGVVKAAKAGILVKLLLVFKKGFIVIILGIGGLVKWLLGRKKDEDVAPARDEPPLAGDPPDGDPPATPPAA